MEGSTLLKPLNDLVVKALFGKEARDSKIEMARNSIKEEIEIKFIAKLTGLTIEEIERLK